MLHVDAPVALNSFAFRNRNRRRVIQARLGARNAAMTDAPQVPSGEFRGSPARRGRAQPDGNALSQKLSKAMNLAVELEQMEQVRPVQFRGPPRGRERRIQVQGQRRARAAFAAAATILFSRRLVPSPRGPDFQFRRLPFGTTRNGTFHSLFFESVDGTYFSREYYLLNFLENGKRTL